MRFSERISKKVTNSFSSGNLEEVKHLHALYGNKIFNQLHFVKGNHHFRFIYYSFLNSHFNIIRFYLETCNDENPITDYEILSMSSRISQNNKWKEWIHFIESDSRLVLKKEKFLNNIETGIVNFYRYSELDEYLRMFPEKLEKIYKNCYFTSEKGLQLKRYLKLKMIELT
jgi:hypothetical protein